MEKNKIAPSILSADFSRLGEEIENVMDAGADWIHVDVMDGHFVPNLTLGAPVVKSLRKATQAFLDVHLMIDRPEDWVSSYIDAGADLVTAHIEACLDVNKFLKPLKESRTKVGMSLRPATPVSQLEPYLKDLDLVLVMTVEPGFGGQSFLEDQLEKIKTLKKIREESGASFLIEVDGGIRPETAKLCAQAGAQVFVAGSYIFSQDYSEAMKLLREAIEK